MGNDLQAVIFLLLLAIGFGPGAFGADVAEMAAACPLLYRAILKGVGTDYREGTPVSVVSVGGVKIPKGAKVFLLGSGGEATVYRVIPADGKPYILRHENGPDAQPPVVYWRNMSFIGEVLSEGEPDKSFQAPGVAKTNDPSVFKMDDVQGHDLETILDQVGHDSPEGKKLRDRFDALCRDFAARAPEVVAKARSEPMRGQSNSGYRYQYPSIHTGQAIAGTDAYVGTAIVWRNVIVDPRTQTFTIIDPY